MYKAIYRRFVRLSKRLSRKGIYEFLRNESAAIARDSTVLSVGAGGEINSTLLEYGQRNSFRIVTIDIDQRRQPDIVGDICTHDLGTAVFDVVVLGEVLEHLYAPHLAIDNVLKALKPGGKLVITVPFIFPIHERPVDYYRYTRYGLEYLLRQFRDVSIRERNSWGEAICVLLVRHIVERNLSSRLAAPLLILLAYALLPFMMLLSRLIKTDFMTSGYLVSARKSPA
jgi:SAM-dependent methyltransferase